MGQTGHRNKDDHLIGDPQDIPSGLHWLRFWLEVEYWNFDLGRNQFDGHSEGLCLLAGINSQESHATNDQYGPDFLPGSSDLYGVTTICEENQWALKEAVDAYVDELRSLGLKGRVHCHDAINAAVKVNLDPPWLVVANNDFDCAKMLPAKYRTKEEFIRRISHDASSKGGQKRAQKSAKTQALIGPARQEFERLARKQFSGCVASSTGRPIATKIADEIYHRLSQSPKCPDEHLPELPTLQKRVGKWLKEKMHQVNPD